MGIRSKKQRIKYVDYRTEIKVRSEVPIIGDHKQLAHVVKLSLSLWGLFAQMPSVIIQRRIFSFFCIFSIQFYFDTFLSLNGNGQDIFVARESASIPHFNIFPCFDVKKVGKAEL